MNLPHQRSEIVQNTTSSFDCLTGIFSNVMLLFRGCLGHHITNCSYSCTNCNPANYRFYGHFCILLSAFSFFSDFCCMLIMRKEDCIYPCISIPQLEKRGLL
nr:MAG TPA: hypothetical protein [Inoviridae sp.]